MSTRRLPRSLGETLDRVVDRAHRIEWPRRPSEHLVLGTVVTAVFVLTVIPLAFLLWTSVWSGFPGEFGGSVTLSHYVDVYLEGSFDVLALLSNSVVVAVGMTATGMAFGLGAALLFVRTDLPTKGAMELVILSCQTIPGYVYAVMYITTYGPDRGVVRATVQEAVGIGLPWPDIYSPWGIGFVAGVNVVPTFYLLTVPALQDMDPALEEVGRIHGASVYRTLRAVTLPLIKPAILSAIIVTFLYGLGEFAVVSMLGVRQGFEVYSTAILSAIKGRFPPAYGETAALAASLLVVTVVFVWYYRTVTRRKEAFMTLTGRGRGSRTWHLGRWRWPLAGALWVGLVLIWLLPIVALLLTSLHGSWQGALEPAKLTLANYVTVLTDPRLQLAFANSVLVAIGGASLGTVLVVGMAYYTERTDGRFRGLVDFLSLTPLAVPGIIMGAGLMFTVLWVGRIHPVVDLYGTLLLVIVGCVVVFIPVASRIAVGNVVQVHADLEEAARVAGASWLRQMREVFLPLFSDTAAVIWLFLALHVIQLLSIPLMLYTGDTVVVPIKLFQLYMYQPDLAMVAAISSMFIVLTVVLVVVLRACGFRFYDLHAR